ncbi:MAG: hypothetical protein OEZ38_07740 [Gammaproteobacteria bacterium]|nr:hypothetical protein [Gammaproteobacteria bacterium]
MIDADIVSDVVREQHSSSVVNNFIKDEVKVAENNISGSSVGSVKDSLVDTNVSARNDDIDINSSKADKEDDQFSSEIDENIKETEVALHEGAETQASEETIVIEEEISERIDDHIQEAVSISESKIIEKNANDIAGKEENPDDDNISEVGEVDASIKEESIGEYVRDDAGDYGDRRRSDIYPLIQVEEKSKINISGIAIGFSLGMLIASILLVAFAFSYIGRSDREVVGTVIEKTVNKVEDKDSKSDEYSKIKAIEAERDRAMEITRSLERERDAAIATAKAQEEMRAAEKRVAELLAEQERKAAIEVRQAKERAMKAEIRAARAAEREKLALEKAKLERIKAEKIRLEKDVMNAEEIQTQTTVEKIADQIIEDKQAYNKENTVSIQNSVHSEANKKQIDGKANNKDEESGKSFVRNPCDSPSAKFLSTCKK